MRITDEMIDRAAFAYNGNQSPLIGDSDYLAVYLAEQRIKIRAALEAALSVADAPIDPPVDPMAWKKARGVLKHIRPGVPSEQVITDMYSVADAPAPDDAAFEAAVDHFANEVEVFGAIKYPDGAVADARQHVLSLHRRAGDAKLRALRAEIEQKRYIPTQVLLDKIDAMLNGGDR